MLTLFTIPKPFEGRMAEIQRTALCSWMALADDVQVLLLGDEPGTAEASRLLGAEHVPGVLRNEHGTPRLDSAFARADAVATHPLRCFVNADIVLLDDFLPGVRRAEAAGEPFLMVGRTIDVDGVTAAELTDPGRFRSRVAAVGVERGAAAIDYFVFPAGLFDDLPPFLVGRAGFDNWLVWHARQAGPVIDASQAVLAVHQRHDYAHLSGGKSEAYYGEEAVLNTDLAGGQRHLYTMYDASRRMRADGSIGRNFGAILRARETIRRSRAKLRVLASSGGRDTR